MEEKCLVITNPMIAANKSAQVTTGKFLRVLSGYYRQIHLIGGNIALEDCIENVTVHSVPIIRVPNKLKRAADILKLQIKMRKIVKTIVTEDTPVYFWVADKMIFPYLAAQKKGNIRYFIYGNVQKEGGPSVFSRISAKLICYMANHADYVYMESPGVIQEWGDLVWNPNIRVLHLYADTFISVPIEYRKNIVGMVCRLASGKHVLESIQAFNAVHERHPEYILEIVGSGRQEAECKALIKELGAQDYIKLMGWVEHDRLPKVTKEWKYLLFPTDTEGMPNSILEMMRQGIPAIASPVGGIRDIIHPGKNGWICSGYSAGEISDSLENALNSSDYENIVQNAVRTIEEDFSLEAARKAAEF